MTRRRVLLMTGPVGDYQGRRRSVAVVERDGLAELQFTGTRGGITPCAVHPSEAFRLLAAICGRTATIHDISGRADIVGAVIRRDASGGLDITQLHVARWYARRAPDILLDGHARACLRAQVARPVLAAGARTRSIAMPAPREAVR